MCVSESGGSAHLILEVYGRIEVRDLGINRLADNFSLASMQERSHLCPKNQQHTPIIFPYPTHQVLDQEVQSSADIRRVLNTNSYQSLASSKISARKISPPKPPPPRPPKPALPPPPPKFAPVPRPLGAPRNDMLCDFGGLLGILENSQKSSRKYLAS
jgi:hypothetical protein